MINISTVIIITFIYLFALFLLAIFVERKNAKGSNWANNPYVYALTIAIYCTSWTFYGTVGSAATSNYLFMAVYIAPTLAFIFFGTLLKRIIFLRDKYGITSISDFLAMRYGRSNSVAIIVTLLTLIGIIPYLALQIKAIFSSFAILTPDALPVERFYLNIIVILFIIVFTVLFGFRRVDNSEQHPGMMVAIAVQSIFKLFAFLVTGIFVSYFLFDGIGDIFSQINAQGVFRGNSPTFPLWVSYIILSMSAIMFLPRQFHVSVVENYDKKHIKTAMWLFPLYLFLILLFVIPIAAAGMLLGYDVSKADFFTILIPFDYGSIWLSILVFLGGLSASISMILVSVTALTSMTSNYLILPVLNNFSFLSFFKKYILQIRWLVVVLIIYLSYQFNKTTGDSQVLVGMGMISFAAVLQFAPAMIGALVWKIGNRVGAISGLVSGFTLWAYTSLFPAFLNSAETVNSIMTEGPFSISFLRPHNLFGIEYLDPLSHTVFLTMLFNISFFVLGSLMYSPSKEEEIITDSFISKQSEALVENIDETLLNISLKEKLVILKDILSEYFNNQEIDLLKKDILEQSGIVEKKVDKISFQTLINIYNNTEKVLAKNIGISLARSALSKKQLITEKESENLTEMYSQIVSKLKISPAELEKRISFFKKREEELLVESEQLEKKFFNKEQELKGKSREVISYDKLSVERELKMIELKKEIKDLKNKLSIK